MERGRGRSVGAIARLAPLGGLAVLVSACALATFNGEDYGAVCSFAGRADKPCGMCIAANCQASVNACCGDTACKKEQETSLFSSASDPGVLQLLDTCATGGSCADLEAHPQAQVMVACIQSSCQNSCDLWRKSSLRAPQTNCERSTGRESLAGSFPACACTVPATTEGAPTTPNTVTCNRNTVTDGQCCASDDWPAPASTCSCRVVVCQPSGASCNCRRSYSYSGTTAGVNACARGGCCIRSDGDCACGTSCSDTDVKVDQCTPSLVVCEHGSRTVESCSTN